MNILVACEESQAVTIELRRLGDRAKKSTCLWLKGLPLLQPTNIVDTGEIVVSGGKRYSAGAAASWATDENGKILSWNDPLTAKLRSKTFAGIARAMAEQWAGQADENRRVAEL